MKSPEQAAFKVILVIAVLIAVAVLPFVVRADAHAPAPPSFEKFDADGDGFISEEEFVQRRAERMAARASEGRHMKGAASAPSFSEFDSNGDGKLDAAEFTAGRDAHRAAMRERHGGKGAGMHHHHGGGMQMPTFADLDLDGNGCIDAEEFAKHQAEHHAKRKAGAPDSAE